MKYLVLLSAIFFLSDVRADGGDMHSGLDILAKIVRQFLKSHDDYKFGDGVHLISTRSENDARANKDDGTVVGVLENYLDSHEVRIHLAELMPGQGFGRSFKSAMSEIYGNDNDSKYKQNFTI